MSGGDGVRLLLNDRLLFGLRFHKFLQGTHSPQGQLLPKQREASLW